MFALRSFYCALITCFSLASLATSAHAQTPDWRVEFGQKSNPSEITDILALPNGDWSVAAEKYRVRLSPSLQVLAKANTDEHSYRYQRGEAIIDGERLLISHDRNEFLGVAKESLAYNCSVRRFNANETLRWLQIIPNTSCESIAVDPNGFIWVVGEEDVFKLRGSDGTLIQRIRFTKADSTEQIYDVQAARGRNAGGAFVMFGSDFQPNSVAFLDAQGIERWRYKTTEEPSGLASWTRLAAASDGGLYVGLESLARLDASGGLQWRTRFELSPGQSMRNFALTPDEGIVLLERGTQCALSKFSSSNSIEWRTTLPCTATFGLEQYRKSTLDNTITVAENRYCIASTRYLGVFSNTGGKLFERDFDGDVHDAHISNDGQRVLFVESDNADTARLSALDVATNQVAAVDLSAISRTAVVPSSIAEAPNGKLFVLAGAAANRELLAIQKNGQTSFRAPESGYAIVGATNDSVCTLSGTNNYSFHCISAANGAVLTDTPVIANGFIDAPTTRLLNDRILFVETNFEESDGFFEPRRFRAVSKSGQNLFTTTLPHKIQKLALYDGGLIAISGAPSLDPITGALVNSDTVLTAWAQNGQETWKKSYPFGGPTPDSIKILSNGYLVTDALVQASGQRTAPHLSYFNQAHQLLWRKELDLADDAVSFPSGGHFFFEDRRASIPALYRLVRARYDLEYEDFQTHHSNLQKYDLATGVLLWRTELNVDPQANFQRLMLPTDLVQGKHVVVVFGQSILDEQKVEVIDGASGESLNVRAANPLAGRDELTSVVSNDVRAVLSHDALGNEIYALEHKLLEFPAKTPVLNPSHIGAWYNPKSPGQGFFLEQIGNTQFLAWFHNDWGVFDANVSDFLSPARQRWLTLQGDVVPGTKSVALKIYDTGGGTFTSASAGAPKQVGTATLSFQGCNSATLSYEVVSQRCLASYCSADERFGNLHGVISLQPLVPATSCGTITSAPAPVSAKTGLFHDPNVSGQGLLSVAGANTFFAGWFAADPSDAADDPQKQVWFTLQADIAANSGNIVNAKIYRTVGGRRDTPMPSMSQEVGTATLTYSACDRVRMQYQFGAAEYIKPFQHRSGTLNLERIGACR